MLTKQCDICDEPVNGETQANLNRNMGLHKRLKHEMRSRGYIPVSQRPGHPKYKGPALSPEKLDQLEKARTAKQEERRMQKLIEESKKAKQLLLTKCPKCGTEFLRRMNGKISAMELHSCETCKIKFWYTVSPEAVTTLQ